MLRILAASLVLATASLATAAPSRAYAVQTGGSPSQSPQERRDAAIYERAAQDFQERGYAGLANHLSALRAALDRMPTDYIQITEQDGTVVARLSDTSDILIMMIALAQPNDKGEARPAVATANVYGEIALILGSDAVERRRYDEAIAYLDRVLTIQPSNWQLLAEKAAALQGAARWTEALALADAALAEDDLLLALHKGPFHRRRGFSLIELGRLDEARAAYEAALEIDAEDSSAKAELDYITKLQSGVPATAVQIISPASPPPPSTN